MAFPEDQPDGAPQPAGDDLPAGLRNRVSRARFCLTCQTIKAVGPSHKKNTGHPYRLLEQREKDSEAERWRARQTRDIAGQMESTSQRAVAQRANHTEAAAQPGSVEPQEYRLKFGKHKRKTIAEVMDADKGYLPWCIVSGVHTTQPSLKRAMEVAGVWEDILRDAEVFRTGQQLKAAGARQVVEVEPVVEAGPVVEHKEIRKLKDLQAAVEAVETDPTLLHEHSGAARRGHESPRQSSS